MESTRDRQTHTDSMTMSTRQDRGRHGSQKNTRELSQRGGHDFKRLGRNKKSFLAEGNEGKYKSMPGTRE